VIDPILEALAEYERTVAPAYELIRMARARLVERVAAASTEALPGAAVSVRMADPIDQPAEAGERAPSVALGTGEADARAASPIQSTVGALPGAVEPEAAGSSPRSAASTQQLRAGEDLS